MIELRLNPPRFNSIRLAKMQDGYGELPVVLSRIGQLLNKRIKTNAVRLLTKRSGDLHDSWSWDVTTEGRGWKLIVGSDVVYAAIHNFGGWAGAGHRSRIPKTRYVDRAIIKTKVPIRKLLRDFQLNILRGKRNV